MKVKRAFRYELKPKKEQLILLAKHAGCSRFAYNWGLSERVKLYKETGRQTNAIEQHRILNTLKQTEYPWMYEVSKCAPQEALRDLDKAFNNFFRGIKEGRKTGFPKYKKKGMHDSFRLTGIIKVSGKSVKLPRLGAIRLKEESNVYGRILSTTVSREADRWFVSLTVEDDITEPDVITNGEIVGIDVGLLSFAVMSDGTKIDGPKPLDKYLKKLKKISRQCSRKDKNSNNRKKGTMALAKLHRKIKNIRQDFLHKLTTNLAKAKQEIILEDLNIRGMIKNKHLSRHMLNV